MLVSPELNRYSGKGGFAHGLSQVLNEIWHQKAPPKPDESHELITKVAPSSFPPAPKQPILARNKHKI
jgi:hypothetical protein